MNSPEVKDSGQRYENGNGGHRDTDEGKPKFKYVPQEIINNTYTNSLNARKVLRIDAIDNLCSRIERVETGKEDVSMLVDIIYSMLYMIGYSKIIPDGDLTATLQLKLYLGLESFAIFMERCAEKYDFENWKKLTTKDDLERFKISLSRHSKKMLFGLEDEFHREAVVFNAMCILINFVWKEQI